MRHDKPYHLVVLVSTLPAELCSLSSIVKFRPFRSASRLRLQRSAACVQVSRLMRFITSTKGNFLAAATALGPVTISGSRTKFPRAPDSVITVILNYYLISASIRPRSQCSGVIPISQTMIHVLTCTQERNNVFEYTLTKSTQTPYRIQGLTISTGARFSTGYS